MTIEVRAATPDDAASIAAVHVAAWRESYAGLLPEAMLSTLSVGERTGRWARALRAMASVFVAERDGEVVGFASACPQRDRTLAARGFTGEITAIYVLRRAQGWGVGRHLMAEVAHCLREREHQSASLWVLRDNQSARRFYERLGGEIIGEKEDRREDVTLVELAYGWRDLSALANLIDAGTPSGS